MKTKELIRQLQAADPSGEIECCVENADIYSVEIAEAYYDGQLQILDRNPAILGYNVTGAHYGAGYKIRIVPHSIGEALCDNPDLPVDYANLPESRRESMKREHDLSRQQIREAMEQEKR
jgi:hypothetical protein